MKLPMFKILNYSRRVSMLIVSGMFVLAFGSTSAYAASSNALPGSALFPLKQLWEKGQTLVSFSPAAKARAEVSIAQDRLEATQAIVASTPAGTNGSNAVDALEQAQQHLAKALEHSNKIEDHAERKEIKKSISEAATETENEAEDVSDSDSSSDDHKDDLSDTSEHARQIRDQASSDD